ncbi:hypothetical protein Daus18300_004598 [Diaporthe australafricana]|uniref:Uncharacterized protein n=1 Tax=Diaporthe australafricana TaxID=127596 RepID=A0ABR3X890_9PEZI
MDGEEGLDDGATYRTGPKTSGDQITNSTLDQPSIPPWMLARNKSVHAPVFEQPPARTSRTSPSIPVSRLNNVPAPSPFAQLGVRDVGSDPKVISSPLRPLPSVNLDKLNDDQALELLLKNETIARMFQDACTSRVEEHQQKLAHAYNQRLLQLEGYTRAWRESTKEIWEAVKEGTFKLNNDQIYALLWRGPQEAGHDFDPESSTAKQEVAEMELDADEQAATIQVKDTRRSHSGSQSRQKWINDNRGGIKIFKSMVAKFRSVVNMDTIGRLLFRIQNENGQIEYRPLTGVNCITRNINQGDVIMELSPSNVAMLGKAFCYIKDTSDRLGVKGKADSGANVSTEELAILYDHFSHEPTEKHIDVLPLRIDSGKQNSHLFKVHIDVPAIPERLLLARPDLATDGSVKGAKFFDVGSDTCTSSLQNGHEVILLEDRATLKGIAGLLCFCVRKRIVSLPLGASAPVQSPSRIALNTRNASTGLHATQQPYHFLAGTVLGQGQTDACQEWIADIKDLPHDFLSERPNGLLLEMWSPQSPKFLARKLRRPRIFFRFTGSQSDYEYFSLSENTYSSDPVLRKKGDVVVEFSVQNVLLFWQAFRLLKGRQHYLLSQVAASLGEPTRRHWIGMHEKLSKHFQDPSSSRPHRASLIQAISLPEQKSVKGGAYDSQADGTHSLRRLVIARPYYQAQKVKGAEFFDIGYATRLSHISSEDIVLTEDVTMLTRISHLLEQAIDINMFPTIEQGPSKNASKKSSSVEIPFAKNQLPAQILAKEPEQPTKSFDMARMTLGTSSEVVNGTRHEEQQESASLKRLTPPQAPLFQRTLALGDELASLNRGICRSITDSQTQNQWLAIGGEVGEERSLSPPLKENTPGISRRQAHPMVLEFANQEIIEVPSGDSENSALVMLDGQPKDISFRLRKKRALSSDIRENLTVKRPRLSAPIQGDGRQSQSPLHGLTHQTSTKPDIGVTTRAREITRKHLDKLRADLKQLQVDLEYKKLHADVKDLVTRIMRQKAAIDRFEGKLRAQACDHGDQSSPIDTFKQEIVPPTGTPIHVLGNQGTIDGFGPLPPTSAFTAGELHKRQMQLEDLKDHLQDQFEQTDDSTLRGKQDEISKLRIDVERFQGVVEAQHEIEAREGRSNGQTYEADPLSSDLFGRLKPSMCYRRYHKSPSTGPASTSYAATPMEDTHSSGFVGENVFEAASAPKPFPRNIPTEPKALRRIPTEPKAMRPARRPCRQWVAGPRAVTVGPITQQHASRIESSSNAAPTNSLATTDQITTSNDLTNNRDTGIQIDHDYQQPLRAVASSPPPTRHNDSVGMANSNVLAPAGRPAGPWGHATHAASAMLDLSDELNGIFDNATCDTDTYAQEVVRSPCSDNSNAGGEVK